MRWLFSQLRVQIQIHTHLYEVLNDKTLQLIFWPDTPGIELINGPSRADEEQHLESPLLFSNCRFKYKYWTKNWILYSILTSSIYFAGCREKYLYNIKKMPLLFHHHIAPISEWSLSVIKDIFQIIQYIAAWEGGRMV